VSGRSGLPDEVVQYSLIKEKNASYLRVSLWSIHNRDLYCETW